MLSVFLAFVAAAACLIICLNAEIVGQRLGVMDHPDNARKVHARATPLIGGMAILLPLLVWLAGALLAETAAQPKTLLVLMLCASGVGLVGFADDQTPTTPLSRILSLLVFLGVAFVIDPSLIARRLATTSLVACASPEYLQQHAAPRTPEELEQHNCLVFGDSAYFRDWPFEKNGQRTVVQARGNLRCGDTGVLRAAAVQGLGVLMLGSFVLADDLQSRRLVPILTDYTIGEFGVYAVYANRRFLPPKVRLFVDTLVEYFGPDPQRDPFLRPSAGSP